MKKLSLLLLAAGAVVASPALAAPLPYAGGTYSQDFNGLHVATTNVGVGTAITGRGPHDINGVYGTVPNQLTNTGVEGWTMSNYGGSSGNTEYRAQNGSQAGSAGRGVVSFGTTSSSDRALGTLATSNQISRFGLTLLNSSNVTYTNFDLDFTVEHWRQGEDGIVNNVPYFYLVASTLADATIGSTASPPGFVQFGDFGTPNPAPVDPLDFFGEIPLDGNLPANQTVVNEFVGGITWSPGTWLVLRWDGKDVTGQDNGLAIDNLSFSAGVPEPTGAVLAGVAAIVLGAVRRRR